MSRLDNWTLLRHDANLTGRPEDDRVVWKATATLSNPTQHVVVVTSFVVATLTQSDGTKVLVQADPLFRSIPDRNLHVGTGGGVEPVEIGETAAVEVQLKTRSGWGVATDNIYLQAEYEGFPHCYAAISGAKPYENRPGQVPPCNQVSNAFACFK